MSVHTTLADANQAVIDLYDIDEDDEQEDGWLSWEDLDGARVQTDSATGAVRVIQVDGYQSESVAWVEEKTIMGTWDGGCEDDDEAKRTAKKRKVSSRTISLMTSIMASTAIDIRNERDTPSATSSNPRPHTYQPFALFIIPRRIER